ncbi:hypothetical protein P8452_66562 [Trifolium repens]|nr:hypothetical protein P8452_66562 [Trifolium repens]
MDRSWMYDRVNSNRFGLKDSFLSGVGEFVNKAMEQAQFLNHGVIRCPCVNCKCIDLKTPREVKHHLYKYGFLPNYYIWTEHGEEDQDVDLGGHFSGGEDVGVEDQFEAMNEMINDAFRPFSNVLNVNANMENETPSDVQYRWMYPFERLMGDSKRSVKNKARVEGSICTSYLHRETTYFCSHYFKTFNLLTSTSLRNNPQSNHENVQPTLSLLSKCGRPSGKPQVYWLLDEEWKSAHVHVLINCDEVKPYLEAFLHYHSIDEQDASSLIHDEFPNWRKAYVQDERNGTINPYVKALSSGPCSKATSWHMYFVNGYKFHTQDWSHAITTKPRGHVEIDNIDDEMPYQSNEMSPIVHITEVEQLRGRGRDTQGKKATNNNRLRVMPPGSLAIANNRMRQQKKPSAAQRAVTAIKKGPSAVQKAQPVQAATPVQEPPSQAATLVQAPPS